MSLHSHWQTASPADATMETNDLLKLHIASVSVGVHSKRTIISASQMLQIDSIKEALWPRNRKHYDFLSPVCCGLTRLKAVKTVEQRF